MLRSKIDLAGGSKGISAATGDGVSEFLDHVTGILRERAAPAGLASKDRHRVALKESHEMIGLFSESLAAAAPEEILSDALRSAITPLERIVGRVDVEDVLGEIFRPFALEVGVFRET